MKGNSSSALLYKHRNGICDCLFYRGAASGGARRFRPFPPPCLTKQGHDHETTYDDLEDAPGVAIAKARGAKDAGRDCHARGPRGSPKAEGGLQRFFERKATRGGRRRFFHLRSNSFITSSSVGSACLRQFLPGAKSPDFDGGFPQPVSWLTSDDGALLEIEQREPPRAIVGERQLRSTLRRLGALANNSSSDGAGRRLLADKNSPPQARSPFPKIPPQRHFRAARISARSRVEAGWSLATPETQCRKRDAVASRGYCPIRVKSFNEDFLSEILFQHCVAVGGAQPRS
jgi:hypothetical protein